MKKFFFAALVTVAIATSAFAGSNNVNVLVLNSFNHAFRNASNVAWTSREDYAKATFTLDDVKMEAFYNPNGELIGSSKGIKMDELPVNAKRTFAKKFSGYTVKEAIRFEGNDESAYYISADNDTESVIVKVSDNEQVSTFKKTNK